MKPKFHVRFCIRDLKNDESMVSSESSVFEKGCMCACSFGSDDFLLVCQNVHPLIIEFPSR